MIRFEKSSVEVSGLVAIEALNAVIFICTRLTSNLVDVLEETEKSFQKPS
jgi:hypothetical protein